MTARVPPDLVREIEAHAKHGGTTRSEAIRECLAVGIETIRNRDGVPGGRVEELLGAIRVVSADEWEQAVADAERDLSMPRGGAPHHDGA